MRQRLPAGGSPLTERGERISPYPTDTGLSHADGLPPPPQDTEISGVLGTLNHDTSILRTGSSANPPTLFSSLPGRQEGLGQVIPSKPPKAGSFNGGEQARWAGAQRLTGAFSLPGHRG